ncbi:hypothetical protein O3M35_006154 [Rhynocoris fuscipes]|uniref:Uncharacterized protein n=1 Tax=Rhynocoris fuscipes TaxID=488301 RepID=A0AAW1DDR3_9HEMI
MLKTYALLLALVFCYCRAIGILPLVQDNCTHYALNCQGNEECCYYPMTMCLPDIQNKTSCLSPLDILNLNPEFMGLDIIGPLLDDLGNATMAIVDIVQINGDTVYNKSRVITGNTTEDTPPGKA